MAELGRLFTDMIERLGQIDIVVVNAGIELIETPIADVTETDFDRLLALAHKIRSSQLAPQKILNRIFGVPVPENVRGTC